MGANRTASISATKMATRNGWMTRKNNSPTPINTATISQKETLLADSLCGGGPDSDLAMEVTALSFVSQLRRFVSHAFLRQTLPPSCRRMRADHPGSDSSLNLGRQHILHP